MIFVGLILEGPRTSTSMMGSCRVVVGFILLLSIMVSHHSKSPYREVQALLDELQRFQMEATLGSQQPVSRFHGNKVVIKEQCSSRWWFQIFFSFTPIWGRFPF